MKSNLMDDPKRIGHQDAGVGFYPSVGSVAHHCQSNRVAKKLP